MTHAVNILHNSMVTQAMQATDRDACELNIMNAASMTTDHWFCNQKHAKQYNKVPVPLTMARSS